MSLVAFASISKLNLLRCWMLPDCAQSSHCDNRHGAEGEVGSHVWAERGPRGRLSPALRRRPRACRPARHRRASSERPLDCGLLMSESPLHCCPFCSGSIRDAPTSGNIPGAQLQMLQLHMQVGAQLHLWVNGTQAIAIFTSQAD